MKKIIILLILVFIPACAGVPPDGGSSATSASASFKDLIESPDQYIGTTVKLGGYILETKNLTEKTTIDVLQTPLTGFRKQPKTKGYSEGRFTVSNDGFLDPAEYSKDRPVTVTGTFMGCKGGKGENCMIKGSQIRLWPEVDPRRTEQRDPRLKDPFYDPDYFKKGAGGFP